MPQTLVRLLKFADMVKEFGSESTLSVGTATASVVPKGVYLTHLATNTRAEYSPDGSTWRVLFVAGSGGLLISDGSNVRLYNTSTASAEISYLLQIK